MVSGSSPLLWFKLASSRLSLAVSVLLSFGVLPHPPKFIAGLGREVPVPTVFVTTEE